MVWRKELERQFIFDQAKAVPVQARVKVEQEIYHLRLKLETELRNGALNLHRLKQEIEENRKKLFPALADARRSHAAAINDWNIVKKRNRILPAIITLVVAFYIGISINSKVSRGGFAEREVKTAQSGNERTISVEARMQARQLYEAGVKYKQEKLYPEAVASLEQAVTLNPEFAAAYAALGFSFHKVKDYPRSIDAWKRAIDLGINNFDTQFGLGMVYIDQENWWLAEASLKEALTRRLIESKWLGEYTEAHYNLGKSIVKGNGAGFEIERLENSLKYADNAEDRFRIAILNLWLGKDDKVLIEYKKLTEQKSELAKELKKLMDMHKRG